MSKIEDFANLPDPEAGKPSYRKPPPIPTLTEQIDVPGMPEATGPYRKPPPIPTLTDEITLPGDAPASAPATIVDGARAARMLPPTPYDRGAALGDAITARSGNLPPPSGGAARMLPPTPPDRGAALGEAITARGGNLPPTPSGGTVRMQTGLAEGPVAAGAPTQPAPAPVPASPIAQGARAELATVEPNRFPSKPMGNQIINPNMRLVPGNRTGSNYVSEEGLAYQNSGAGNKIPDQVGNRKLNRVLPQGVPPAEGFPARAAGRGTPVPNMPPPAEPVTSPTQRMVPPPANAGGAPGAAAPGAGAAAQGRYGRIADAASRAIRAGVPETLGGSPLTIANPLLRGAASVGRWVQPAIEAGQVAKVALDPNSSKADVAEQTAVAVGRGASTLAGAGLGATAGAALGPVGSFLGGVAGGAAGYWGGDESIRKLRSVFGLDERTPSERVDARQPAAKGAPTAQTPSIAQAATQPAGAPPTTRTSGAAPAGQPADANGLAARYQALQNEQLASPIAFTLIGKSGGTEVYYKNGNVARLGQGEAAPDEVVRYHALSDQLHAMRNGQAPAAAAPQMQPVTSAQNSSPIQQNIVAEASRQGYDPQLALAKMSLETGGTFKTDAKNPESSAYGLGQMLASNRAKYGTEAQWKDPAFQLTSSIDFMKKQDADIGQRLGHMPSPTESYLGHLLGPAGGAALLRANQDLPIEQVVASFTKDKNRVQDIVQKNGMTGLTAGQAVDKWGQLMKQHLASVGQAGAAPGAPAASPAAYATVPEFRQETPVGVIEGLQRSMEIPMPGGYYARVPADLASQGVRRGDLRGTVQASLDRQEAANAYADNRTQYQDAAKLEEKRIEVAGHLAAAQAGRNRYLPMGGGTDPATGMAMPQYAIDSTNGQRVDGAPKTWPMPGPGAIEDLKKAPQTAPLFDAMFGPGAAQKMMGR